MYKILTMDGGGLRSAFQARLIDRLEKELGRKLKPDLTAGTSSGAIVAAGMQFMNASDIVAEFRRGQSQIFDRGGLLDKIENFWNLDGAKYGTESKFSFFREVFGDKNLGDLPSKILITAFNLKASAGWEPVVFHNFDGQKNSKGLSIVDAIMRSTAAPIYFPVYQDYADGGVWGNNPSMAAIAAAGNTRVGGKGILSMAILSIGTGRYSQTLKTSKNDLGIIDWVQDGLIDILLDGNIESAHYFSGSLLGPAYYRIQISLKEDIKLDAKDAIPRMIDHADSIDLSPILSWMEGFWI